MSLTRIIASSVCLSFKHAKKLFELRKKIKIEIKKITKIGK